MRTISLYFFNFLFSFLEGGIKVEKKSGFSMRRIGDECVSSVEDDFVLWVR